MDYPLCALQRGGWWGGSRTCFRGDILTKTGTEEGDRGLAAAFSLSRFASLLFWFYLFHFLNIIIIFYFFSLLPPHPPRVCETEKCSQNCCAAPWLWSCMSTLWAPISATMTGTCWDEWMRSSPPVLLTPLSPLCVSDPLYTTAWHHRPALSFVHSFIYLDAVTLNEQCVSAPAAPGTESLSLIKTSQPLRVIIRSPGESILWCSESSWCSFTSSACQKLSNHYIPVSCRHLLSGEFTRLWSHTVSTYSSHVPCSRRGHFCFLFYRMSSEIRIVLGAKCSRVWTFPKSLSCTGGNNWSLEEKLCLPAPQDESRTVLNVQPDESVWLWIRFSKKKMNGRVVTLRLKPSVWGMELSARVQRGNALLIAGLLIFDGWMVVRASGSLMQPPCLDVGQRHRYFPPAIIS